MDENFFDPGLGQAGFSMLSEDDPLRAWAEQNVDPHTGALLASDPQAAIERLISAGVPPPPVDAPSSLRTPFVDPSSGMNVPGADPFSMVRTNPDGTIAGNLTNPDAGLPPKDQSRVPVVTPPAPERLRVDVPPTRTASAGKAGESLDPEEDSSSSDSVPIPSPRPDEAPKKKVSGALSGFGDSLKGVKPVPPPPVNPVGTPSVRGPLPVQAAPLTALLALAGQGAPPSAMATLGRLLAAGKV